MIASPLALLLALAASSQAQEPSWDLPPGGVAVYERTFKETTEVLETDETGLPPTNPPLHIYRTFHNPPLVFAGELTADRRGLRRAPADLRDLSLFVAADLRDLRAGKTRFVAPRILPFGDVLGEAVRAAPEPDGSLLRQTIVCRLHSRPPQPAPDERADLIAAWFGQACRHSLRGTLEVRRTIDPDVGVREFEATLDVEIRYPQDDARQRARLHITETWRLREVRAPRSGDFRDRVADAIRRGAQWIRSKITDPTQGEIRPGRTDHDGTATFATGRLALAALTLLKAEIEPTDPILAHALRELRRREITDTYSLGTAMMVLDALYAPPGERQLLIDGNIDRPLPRELSSGDRALMRRWADQVMQNLDGRVTPGSNLRWSYVPGQQRYDTSLTQYALLGLYSASLCGIELKPSPWPRAAEHLVEDQLLDKRRAPLLVTSYATRKRAPAARRKKVAVGGWTYHRPDNIPATGSMTAAGITGLALCNSAMRSGKRAPRALLRRTQAAIDSGFAWLGENFSLLRNPGHAGSWPHWRLYYLYSLERACELALVERIADRDWYYEGAELLLAMQLPNGEFEGQGLTGSCFAVLFLMKAALPVHTGERR